MLLEMSEMIIFLLTIMHALFMPFFTFGDVRSVDKSGYNDCQATCTCSFTDADTKNLSVFI